MVPHEIEQLLEKYDNAQTSTQEEQQLRDYFTNPDNHRDGFAQHLEPYRAMFGYFTNAKQETFTKALPVQVPKRSYVYQWIGAAAVVAIMFGIFFQFGNPGPKTLDSLTAEEQLVYYQTREALGLLSTKFNQSASNVTALNMVGNHFDKGMEKAKYINEFSKATNKILKQPKN